MCRATSSASRCDPGSPAGARSTTCAAPRQSATARCTSRTTSRTGRSRSTSRSWSSRRCGYSSSATRTEPHPSTYRVTVALAALTCALAPAYIVRWHYAFYPTTLLEHAVAITVVAYIVETWRAGLRPAWRTPFTYAAILFIIAGALDVFFAPSRTAALGLYRAYIIEPIAFAFVLVNVVTTARRALTVLGGLGVAGIWVAAPNIVVVLEALRSHTYDVTQTPPVVIYTTANALALFLGRLIAVAVAILLHDSDRYARAGSAIFLVIAGPAMLLSFSRGGFLAMAAVAVGLALSHRRRWWLLAGVVVTGGLVAAVPPVFHRITPQFPEV